jgi:ParB family transcriptional regulator, chromosome partitioning protein
VRRLVAAAKLPPADEPPTDDPNVYQTRRLEDAFRSALGTKVALTRGRKGGKLVISFFSDEELQSIYEHIVGSE